MQLRVLFRNQMSYQVSQKCIPSGAQKGFTSTRTRHLSKNSLPKLVDILELPWEVHDEVAEVVGRRVGGHEGRERLQQMTALRRKQFDVLKRLETKHLNEERLLVAPMGDVRVQLTEVVLLEQLGHVVHKLVGPRRGLQDAPPQGAVGMAGGQIDTRKEYGCTNTEGYE